MKYIEKHNINGIFKKISDVLKDENKKASFTIVGGTAFILHNLVNRKTIDIDVINKNVDKKLISYIANSLSIDINNRSSFPSMKYIFEGWEDDALIYKKYSNVTIYLPTKNFLIMTKFFTRRNDRDLTEGNYSGKDIDQNKIESIVESKVKKYEILLPMLRERQFEIMEFYRQMGWNYEKSKTKYILQKKFK